MSCGRTLKTRMTDMSAPRPTARPMWPMYTSDTRYAIRMPATVMMVPEVITVGKLSLTARAIASCGGWSFLDPDTGS